MCLTIPHKVIKVKDNKATVECSQKPHTLDIRLVPDVKKGDYLLNENDYAVYIVPKKDALETIKLIKDAKERN